MADANMQDTITEIGLEAEKARYLLDEILVGYYDCVDDPGYEQHRKLLVEFKRIWLKLSIILKSSSTVIFMAFATALYVSMVGLRTLPSLFVPRLSMST